MLIAIDIGNTHIRLSGYEEDEQVFIASIAAERNQTMDYYACSLKSVFSLYDISVSCITDAIISSVVPSVTTAVRGAVEQLCGCKALEVSSGIKTGVNIRLEQPKQVGADRVVTAAAAKALGKLPCVIVDCSTATTFTVLDSSGAMVGSAIAAGVDLSLEALRHSAAQLPLVRLDEPFPDVLGKNTEEAMRSGIIIGAAAMVDGMVLRLEEKLGEKMTAILTGGQADLVLPHLKTEYIYKKALGLEGLYQIWKKNQIG